MFLVTHRSHLLQARITLHGHVRCTEIPIYGCKGIGVREGLIQLHGRPIVNTWTRLASTAEAGASDITVEADVSDWRVGDEIAIASTGLRHDQGQNEKRKIQSISGKTITLDAPLTHKHMSISQVPI